VSNARVPISLAISDYEHVRDLSSGVVRVEGVELTALEHSVEEIFYRFTEFREWHASEMSMARYVSMRAAGDDSLTAIPVFPSRVFRHSSFYVRRDSGIADGGQLFGKRIGIPEWAQTAGVYARGLLVHEYGVPLTDVRWVQGGVNQAGRRERVPIEFPDGVDVEVVSDRSLNDMLVAGDLDAVISARPPVDFVQGGAVVRLFDDFRPLEQDYARRTGIFPIMHTIALRRDVVEEHPWVARNLLTAFEEAKERSLARAADITQSRWPIPWSFASLDAGREIFGGDPWPYGIEPNRRTLEAFLAFTAEQGVARRRLEPEDIFAPQTHSEHRV
jgi:4,5-dihydroxyphthalate decarboxylase